MVHQKHLWRSLALSFAPLMSGCAPAVQSNGAHLPSVSALAAPTFFTAPLLPGHDAYVSLATDAVRENLVSRGYVLQPDARYRVDVGVAVGARQVEVVRPEEKPVSGQRRAQIALCRREKYVLSVAIVDRTNGRIVFRNSASTSRCGNEPRKFVQELVRAALG